MREDIRNHKNDQDRRNEPCNVLRCPHRGNLPHGPWVWEVAVRPAKADSELSEGRAGGVPLAEHPFQKKLPGGKHLFGPKALNSLADAALLGLQMVLTLVLNRPSIGRNHPGRTTCLTTLPSTMAGG